MADRTIIDNELKDALKLLKNKNKDVRSEIFRDEMLNLLFVSVFSLTMILGGFYGNYKFFTDVYLEDTKMRSLLYFISVSTTVVMPQVILWILYFVNFCKQMDHYHAIKE